MSESVLQYVDIFNGGVGRGGGVHSALESVGVAPRMDKVRVEGSAFGGINVTAPASVVSLVGVTSINNAGYGVYVNTSSGSVSISPSRIPEKSLKSIKIPQNPYKSLKIPKDP